MGVTKELDLNAFLNIRYIKIHFKLVFTEDTIMPRDKVSAFRGGIGEMMLRANCIRDRKCDSCDFEEECIVQRVMYSKAKITPRSAGEGESFGYVLECRNTEEQFLEGEQLELNLILFGKNIVYFNQYLSALAALGTQGIGKHKSKFAISEIRNTKNESILENGNIYMGDYKVESLKDYVEYRYRKVKEADQLEIRMQDPIILKQQGRLLKEFNLEAFYKAAVRRLYMMNCFEGTEMDAKDFDLETFPYQLSGQEVHPATIQRYSNHQNQKMFMNGIKGKMLLTRDKSERAENNSRKDNSRDNSIEDNSIENIVEERKSEQFLKILLAGELLHIGKSTSFGLGGYMVKRPI